MSAFFFGPQSHRLYGVHHAPDAERARMTQVVLCPPFGQEAVRTHRLYRLLADQLARQGLHVLRFDYFGTGESAGEDHEGSLSRWQQDIQLAHAELQARTGARETIWFGTRLGATLALMASHRGHGGPDRLVLWEPILDGPAYLDELAAAQSDHTYIRFIHAEPPPARLDGEALGFGINDAWLRELQSVSVDALVPAGVARCDHIATRESSACSQLAAHARAQGITWQHHASGTQLAWHDEEAGATALAPAPLMRLVVSVIRGEQPVGVGS